MLNHHKSPLFHYDLKSLLEKKKILCYGAGFAFLSIVESFDLTVSYIIDDTSHLQYQHLNGLPIYPSKRLLSENKDDILIIICANTPTTILGISSSLNRMGFEYGRHYLDCSFLHYASISAKLAEHFDITPNYERFLQCRLLSLYSTPLNLSTIAGTWLFVEVIDSLYPDVLGDVAECGVYQGANVFISLLLSSTLGNRLYHLFDSFEGFPGFSENDPSSRQKEFANVDFGEIRDLFHNFANVKIHKGFFQQTLSQVKDLEFSFVYIDCDLYEPALYCMDFFYKRLSKGGCLLIHDYWLPTIELPLGSRDFFRGINQAVNEFFSKDDLKRLIVFPETTHALIVKK
jgi:hypothetical protein